MCLLVTLKGKYDAIIRKHCMHICMQYLKNVPTLDYLSIQLRRNANSIRTCLSHSHRTYLNTILNLILVLHSHYEGLRMNADNDIDR